MKLIYVKEGETLEAGNETARATAAALLQVADEVRQFDKAGNEIVMYVKL